MQYSVPQFVDVENKIVGPITVRQFIMIAIGLGLIFLFYRYADTSLFILATILIVVFVGVVGFIKINGRPFHYFLLNLFQSAKDPHKRVWKKDPSKLARMPKSAKKHPNKQKNAQVNYTKIAQQKAQIRSRLSDLSLLADTGTGINSEPTS